MYFLLCATVKILSLNAIVWGSVKPTKNNRINKHKSQCITNEWPDAPASISTGAEALASIFYQYH